MSEPSKDPIVDFISAALEYIGKVQALQKGLEEAREQYSKSMMALDGQFMPWELWRGKLPSQKDKGDQP